MADSVWREKLNTSSIFEALAASYSELPEFKDSLNILACKDDSIFIWDEYNRCVLTTSFTVSNNSSDRDINLRKHQVLMCSHPPIGKVTDVILNERGNLLALIGPHGITVLELPIRWGKYAEFEGGKPTILCKCYTIAERFFVCNPKVKVLQANWFPETDSYITVLSCDNYLRLYRVDDPQTPVQVHCLSDNEIANFSTTSLNVALSLGETAISFDFGPALDSSIKAWSVFILKGNGDLYSMVLHLPTTSSHQYRKTVLHGPLVMHPAADDNYGVDACSLICLHSNPPVLVIASSSGTLYHCVALENVPERDNNRSAMSQDSLTKKYEDNVEWSLFAIERIELELSMTTCAYEEDIMCPILLHRDPTTYSRYHCSHSAGVHIMALPVIQNFEQFMQKDETSSLASFQQQESIVEHLICTKPLADSPDSPIVGVGVLVSHLPSATLLCLTSQLAPICLPITNMYVEPSTLLSDTVKESAPSPLKKAYCGSFEKHISQILQRSSSYPLIKSNPATEPIPQECLQLLTRATQVFREEYISRLDIAREEIEKRVRVLSLNKDQQLAEIESSLQQQESINADTLRLKLKYEQVYMKQTDLVKRAENVLVKVQQKLPVFSDAERSLHRDFKDMERHLIDFQNRLESIKKTQEYQDKQMLKRDAINAARKTDSLSAINESQMGYLKTAISKEATEIYETIQLVNTLKKELAL